MTSKIVVNNIGSDTGINTVSFDSNIQIGTGTTLHSAGLDLGTGNITGHNLHSTGIITATSFVGSGANLTNLASTSDINNLISNIAILGFKVATNGSLAKYSLVNQVIDEFVDASGIDASASTNELLQSGYYTGGATSQGNATGGTITTVGGFKYHEFRHTGRYNGQSGGTNYTTSYNFVVPGSGTLEYVVVGGGGRGESTHMGWNGSGRSRGGEGGDTAHNASFSATAQTYTIVVGGGADGWTSSQANNGANSSAFGVTADGGAHSYNNNGNGADGQQFSNFSQFGEQVSGGGWFGGDGGSGGNIVGVGGKGGAGNGGYSGTHSTSGDSHTGGGGGGAESGYASGNGGHGIVLVRYADNAFTSTTEGADLTLQSNDTTAVDGAPTKADLIMLMENAAGTATLNTDIKGFISRDSGTTFTQGTLVDEGSYGTSTKRILAFHDLDISGQPSGTSVCYKITTHNQSGSKKTRIHAVSHGWK